MSDLLPTPAVNDMGEGKTPPQWDEWTARMKREHNNGNGHGASLSIEAQRLDLLPTPRAGDGDKGGPNQLGSSGDLMLPSAVQPDNILPTPRATRGRAATETAAMLPTPKASDGDFGTPSTSGRSRENRNPDTTGTHGTTLTDATVRQPSRWGKYAAAIERWERITRPAPEPTHLAPNYIAMKAKRIARKDQRPVGMRGSLREKRQLAAKFSEWMMGLPDGWITDVDGITRSEALKAAGNGVVWQQAAEALRYLIAMPTGREIADAYAPMDLLELAASEDGGAA